jgi:peptide deformylase
MEITDQAIPKQTEPSVPAPRFRLYPHGHIALHSVCEPVTDIPARVSVIQQMLEVCKNSKLSIGLSAPQVGIIERFFVFSGGKGTDLKAAINPRVLETYGELKPFYEGCMSLPQFQATVLRHEIIDVAYTDLEGKAVGVRLLGMEARCFQHELDHLNGINITDHCSKNDLRKGQRTIKAMAKLAKKMERETVSIPIT